MEFKDIAPRHGEVEYWHEKAMELECKNRRLREALEEIEELCLITQEGHLCQDIAREALK